MMSAIAKSAFLAAACFVGAATVAAASHAGSMNAIGSNALVSPAGEADVALNAIRLDSTTLGTVPGSVWAKDATPPEPD